MVVRLAALTLLLYAAAAEARPRWQELPLPPALPEPASSGEVVVDGAKIHYATYGKGVPVLLLHGGLGSGEQFGFQVPALAEKYQLVLIDTRGHGRSTLTKAKLTYHLMAEDVIAVMDKLELPHVAIVGWSDGGEIGLDLAIHHADRIAKLFVIGANYDVHGSKNRGDHTETFARYGAKCRKDYDRLTEKSKRKWDALVDAMMPVWHAQTVFTKDQLRSITVPTVVADGDHDEIIELAQVKEMATLIPKGKLVVFENASHFVMWQDPEAVNHALVEFLDDGS